MKYKIGTIGIVLDDKKTLIDNAIKMFSGSAAHVFCVVEDNKIMEMHCPKGAILRSLDDYRKKSKTVLMAAPLFMSDSQCKSVAVYLMNMVRRGVKYDYRGIIGQALKFPDKINNKERYYCSEAVGEAFAACAGYYFMDIGPARVTPSDQAYDVETRTKDGVHLWDLTFLRSNKEAM